MMHRTTLAAAAALFALSACQKETVVQKGGDDMQAELANAKPVVLPPSLKSDKAYRCKDGSLAYVELFQGDKMANVRADKGGAATKLEAPEAGKPMVAEGGYSLTVSGETINLTRPGKGAQSCKA
jgi:uncharacterized lipoprotein